MPNLIVKDSEIKTLKVGLWEMLNNPNFKWVEFDPILNKG